MPETEPKIIIITGETGQVYATYINPGEAPDELIYPISPPPADLAHGE